MADDQAERHRALARSLHQPRRRSRRTTQGFVMLHVAIARYRVVSEQLHARLVELEKTGNDNVGPLRLALQASNEQVESLARLVGVPAPPPKPPDDDLSWLDAPTLRRNR